MSFQNNLDFGRVAESLIAKWIMANGYSVLPAYEIEKHQGKGPQLFRANAQYVAPDILAIGSNIFWAEAKHKTVFTWHRNTKQWTTGIDLRHYEEYLKVQECTNIPVWLFFYHKSPVPSFDDIRHGCPEACPTGLFGGKISELREREHHRCLPLDYQRSGYLGHGHSGMVYWHDSAFSFHAPCEAFATLAA